MLDRPKYTEILDYRAFANSLGLEQAGFLLLALKESKHKSVAPLKLALQERLDKSPIQGGVGKRIAAMFYKGRKER